MPHTPVWDIHIQRDDIYEVPEPKKRETLRALAGIGALLGISTQRDHILKFSWDVIQEHAPEKITQEMTQRWEKWCNGKVAPEDFQTVEQELCSLWEKVSPYKQDIYNAMLSAFYFTNILPLFLEDKANEALILSIPVATAWLGVSNEETREKWFTEMRDSFTSVIWIAWATGFASLFQVDIYNISNTRVKNVHGNQLKKAITDSTVQSILDTFNIVVDYERTTPKVNEKTQKVHIPVDRFREILPLLQSRWGIENLPDIISRFFGNVNRWALAKKTMKKNVTPESIRKIDINPSTRDMLNSLAWGILKEEISTLFIISFLSQIPFLGNGQAKLLKPRIEYLAESLSYLALSNSISVDEANNLKNRFKALLTSFFFGRLSYSDIGIYIGAIAHSKEWPLTAIKAVLDGQGWMIVWNTLSLIFWGIDNLLYESGVPNTYRFDGTSKRDWGKIKRWPADYAAEVIFVATEYFNFWKNWNFSPNNADIVQWIKTAISDRSARALTPDSFTCCDTLEELSPFLEELAEIFGEIKLTDTQIHICGTTFTNYLELIYFLLLHKRTIWDEACKSKIDYVLNQNPYEVLDFLDILQSLPQLDPKSQEVAQFLSELFKPDHDDNSEESIFDKLIDKFRNGVDYPELGRLISRFDLDLSIQAEEPIYGRVEYIAKALSINVRFLKHIETTDTEECGVYENFKDNFIANLDALYQREQEIGLQKFKFYQVELVSAMTQEQIDFLNKIIPEDKEYLKITITKKDIEDFDSLEVASKLFWWVSHQTFWKLFKTYRGTLELMFGREFKSVESLFKWFKLICGRDMFAIIEMVLLIQSPYITTIEQTITSVVGYIDRNGRLPEYPKTLMVYYAVYIISKYTKSYIWMTLWTKLMQELLGMDEYRAIAESAKVANLWGWAFITWKTPNAIIDTGNIHHYGPSQITDPEITEDTLIAAAWWEKEWKEIKRFESRIKEVLKITDEIADVAIIQLMPLVSDVVSFPHGIMPEFDKVSWMKMWAGIWREAAKQPISDIVWKVWRILFSQRNPISWIQSYIRHIWKKDAAEMWETLLDIDV